MASMAEGLVVVVAAAVPVAMPVLFAVVGVELALIELSSLFRLL
jgi:hypothetical protein